MLSNNRPLIAVVGALSKQGRSVVRTLLATQRYRVRVLTRRVTSPEALALAVQGAELMTVPLELGHKDAFIQAFKGAYGVFLMTPGMTPEASHAQTQETALGKQLADAAVAAGVEHIVFSSLENVEQRTGGKKWAPHFTDKAKIEDYIRTLPVTSSFIQLAFFYTNLLEYYQPRLEAGRLVFPVYLPEHFRAPFVDPLTATGPAVLEIFDHREKYAGQTLPVVGDIVSPQALVETFTQVTGKPAVYGSAYSREELLKHFPGFSGMDGVVDEIIGMAEYAVEYGYYSEERDVLWSRKINPDTLSWKDFLITSGWQGEGKSFGF